MKQKLSVLAVVFVVLIKLPFLLTHHIQEDAFITWRVAQNLLDYGVIGFNGDTKISASTTHLYVFVSYLFNLILGKENFIYPILIFNSTLFTIGSYLLAKMLLESEKQRALFILIFGMLPPSIKVSILGMEYGILFFLEMSLLYYGFYKARDWALIVLPPLILFTRIDTVIFLGIIFVADVLWRKKIRWWFVLGGVIGVGAALSFNLLYFDEVVNNTIKAKNLAYEKSLSFNEHLHLFWINLGNFWGMLKLPMSINPFTILVLAFELLCFIYLIRERKERNFFIIALFSFGWVKQVVFLSQRSYFDWYYWVPQVLLFVPVLIFVIEQKVKRGLWVASLSVFYILPMLLFQIIHSVATGNGEWNYRRGIGLYLKGYETDKEEWIFLEPAGFVPYFSGLRTIDEVGLVDKEVQEEIINDRENYKYNTIRKREPKYILSYTDLNEEPHADFYKEHYKLLKKFRIKEHLSSENKWLEKIYQLKPSGTDYNLYERKSAGSRQ